MKITHTHDCIRCYGIKLKKTIILHIYCPKKLKKRYQNRQIINIQDCRWL